MRPYAANTNRGRTVARDDIHHRTADQPKSLANLAAKVARHGARQDGAQMAARELGEHMTARQLSLARPWTMVDLQNRKQPWQPIMMRPGPIPWPT